MALPSMAIVETRFRTLHFDRLLLPCTPSVVPL